jgi:hypothetical protein
MKLLMIMLMGRDYVSELQPPVVLLFIPEVIYIYRVYYVKWDPETITYYGAKIKSEADPSLWNMLSQPPL